jgi:hypothetical protein
MNAPRLCLVILALAGGPSLLAGDRLRIIVETDAGGDPDDEQSLVRFLLYTNEWDVEGILANRALARDGENRNVHRTGPAIARALVDAYGECHARLIEHDPRYPAAERLRAVTVDATGEAGVDLVTKAADSADPRPVWFLDWGTDDGSAESSLKRALDRARRERGPEGYARFKGRFRLSSADAFGDHTWSIQPSFTFWVDTFRPELERKRWYHRFSALTATAGGFDVERDLRSGHGPLGALYPTNTTHPQKEGDTMTFLYLVPTGMNDPAEPGWGSWAGRYGPREGSEGRAYWWANRADRWSGETHRENTLKRWAADLQNDFRARLDWCVKPRGEANHPPRAVALGVAGKEIVRREARAGTTFDLTAAGTDDPDGDRLEYEWSLYPEASGYEGKATIEGSGESAARLVIPPDDAGKSMHVILTVRDRGDPPLAAYRRIVIACGK